MTMFKTKEEVIDTIINEQNILIVQDIDGVCIPLVQDPLKREINKEYVKDVSRLREKFAVLTCGEHEGRRGVNRLVEKALNSKTIAKEKSETIAKFSTPIIYVLMNLFKPAIWFFERWRMLLDKVFNFDTYETISEDELLSIVDQAEMGGSIEDHEHRLVRSAIEFDDLEVSKILMPRVDVVACDVNEEDSKIDELFSTHNFSRLIVYDDTIDNIVNLNELLGGKGEENNRALLNNSGVTFKIKNIKFVDVDFAYPAFPEKKVLNQISF